MPTVQKDNIETLIKKYSSASYLYSIHYMALEAWSRGLKTEYVYDKKSKISKFEINISSDLRTHTFYSSQGDLTSPAATLICTNKTDTKKSLLKNNLPTPQGKSFSQENEDIEIINYAESIGYPLVIKPEASYGGKGVAAGINSLHELKSAIKNTRDLLGYKSIIVEKYLKGDEHRFYVIDRKVVAILKRMPANVTGDGISSIKNLIIQKNEYRKTLPSYDNSLIKINREMKKILENQGYELNSVLPIGETVLLNLQSNIGTGGDPIDVTGTIPKEYEQMAIDATKSIEGLPVAGVDILIDKKNDEAVIIEVNHNPNIGMHLFPASGQARDIPGEMIDFYFPESKNNQRQDIFYFDIKEIIKFFKNAPSNKTYVLPQVGMDDIKMVELQISGDFFEKYFPAWIYKNAIKYRLYGNISFISSNKLSILFAGEKLAVEKFAKLIYDEAPNHSNITNIDKNHKLQPIKIGFEIINEQMIDGYYPVRLIGSSKVRKKSRIKTAKNN